MFCAKLCYYCCSQGFIAYRVDWSIYLKFGQNFDFVFDGGRGEFGFGEDSECMLQFKRLAN